jgi:signal transduction histidine kinase
VLDILAGGAEEVAAWKERLTVALGVNARLMVDVIPPLQILLGEQHPVPELPLGEAKNRFHMVFRQLLGALASEEHPLTLFLDDLQWAASASLELLAEVLTHPGTRHLLAVGAYRDNEVTAAHPLMTMLDRMRESPLALRELVLAPLSRAHLRQLVADTMRRPMGEVEPLATLVGEKTAGNPFFAIQFLTSLHEDGLLRFDAEALAWRCDIEAARARGYSDNVVDLMVAKLRRLSNDAQEAVAIAACAGNAADTGTLAVLRGRSEEETHRDLWELVREELLVRSGDTYTFSHDRVQQAAYALISEDRRCREHLTVGRLLLAHTPAGLVTYRAASSIGFGYMASFWTRHVGSGLPELEEGLRAGTETGDDNARLYREVQRADQRKSEFIAVLSHELRNPLAPIRTGLQLLRSSPPDSPIATKAREIMERQTEHLTRLVNDLLDITRISRGRIELQRARIDVRDVVRSTCDDLQPLFERGTLELRLDLPGIPIWIEADETRLVQALWNLLQNAAKFTPAGGSVTVRVATAGGCAEVSVRDTGAGITPDVMKRLFEPFAQAEQGLARTQGGLGLGLALARGLIALHGGSIRARSEGPGRGSEFVVSLPLVG